MSQGRTGDQQKLPTGTIAFLFTDIEGSTRLVQELGVADWSAVLERHRAILRTAITDADGQEVQTEGDSFFAVFKTAAEAVAAAADGQRWLAEETWPVPVSLAVRMGIHTGEGILDSDGSYVGADVHRAARVAAAAHGGQVVLSDATRILLGDSLPPGTSLLDLGEHRLRDLRVERLSQLCIAGLRSSFPPLNVLDRQPNNLPAHLTSFVGREAELAEVGELLSKSRLLTLTGPGGTGKTRLSLQLAADQASAFSEGVWFVALEPIRDPKLVAPTIARTLGIGLSSGRPAADLVAEWIGSRRLLLVLDNFEQVISAAPVAGRLLRACPNLKVVCTSRSVLRVDGEQEYQVPGLPAPPDLSRLTPTQLESLPEGALHPAVATLSQYEAVRLFIARAQGVKPDFAVTNENAPAVAQICARLHGMPLAIELAAARTKLLTPRQILDRLEHQLALLTSGSRDLPERQQTLRGAIAWSYQLLDDELKQLASELAVFSGGWDLEAAEAVADQSGVDVLDGLAALVDQSLVRREEITGTTRFEMLPTIRDFLSEILARDGRQSTMSDRHAEYYLGVAEVAAPALHGDDQRLWMDRLERDHDNLRAALDWATEKPDPELAVRLAFALWRFWQQRGYVLEAGRRLELLKSKQWPLPDPLQARLAEAAGGIAYWQADHGGAVRYYNEALAVWRALGDKKEIANAIYNLVYAELIPVIRGQRDITPDEATAAVENCGEALRLYQDADDLAGEGNIIWALATLRHFSGESERADALFTDAIARFRDAGQRTMEAWAHHVRTLPLVGLGRIDEAGVSARTGMSHFNAVGDLPGVAMALRYLSGLAILNKDWAKAGRLFGAAERLLASTGAGLTAYLEDVFLKSNPEEILPKDRLAELAEEGAAMSLDEIVDYALRPDSPET